MNQTKKIAATLALGSLLVAVPVAYACSLVPEPQVTDWLGMSWYDEPRPRPPANLASVAPIGEGTSFRVGSLELFRVPEGTTEIDAFGERVLLDTTPDEIAPSIPELQAVTLTVSESDVGCGGMSSCGTIARVDYDVVAEDDRAPHESLTFAIWLSRERRAPVGAPDHLVVADRYGSNELWTYGDEDWEGRDLWAVIQVLDQAGNASGFSEPFLVDTGKRGCTTSGVPTGTLVPVALGLLLVARRRRR
ncbi:MAG: hypothetical protein MUE69_21835 [Myxococcota bacterium]|jgi:uncharacterized protein (TIGR03382 family)|nr:hypothetical protein [Myxococcota bacterium]